MKNAIFLLLCALFFAGCTNDFNGIIFSTDLDKRLEEKDSFKFLKPGDMTLNVPEDEYSFIVINDLHIENGKTYGFEKLKDAVNGAEFIVINGDITQYGNRNDIERFIEITETLNVPCYPAIGNHDVYHGNWSEWKELIGSTCYRINGDYITLFILDSANACFGKEQLDWLEGELKTAKGRVFVFSHTNLFVKNPTNIFHFTDTRERARIVSILQNRCDAMFMGHLHRELVRETGGVKYITVDDYRYNRVYCRVTVSKTGVSWEFLPL